MKPTLSFDPALPLLQMAALAIAAVVFAVWLYRRRERANRAGMVLTVLRAAAIAVLGFLLLNPVVVRTEETPSGKSPLLVLVDTSHSMATKDVAGEERLDAARHALLENADLIQKLQRRYRLLFYSLAGDATRQDPETFATSAKATGDRTCIGESMAHALAGAGDASAGGVLIVSDGRNNGDLGPVEIAKQAKARRFPVFTACLGQKTRIRDVAVDIRRPQVYAAPNQQVTLAADITSSGYQNQQAHVDLLREGKPVTSKTVTLTDAGHSEVTFPATEAKKGSYRYTIAVKPLPNEVTNVNNRGPVLLSVANTNTKVLVLEGRPTWDAKFLIQALHTDPGIELDAIFKLTSDRFFEVKGVVEEGTPTVRSVKVPATAEELAKYDVVIVGKGFEEFYDAKTAEQLKKYVSEGGGHLVLLRGKPEQWGSTLADLEPVTWANDQVRDFRMKLTSEGMSNPTFGFGGTSDPQVTVQHLPTLISATRVGEEKSLAVVLARANGVSNSRQPNREMAVLAYQQFGQGMVVSLVGQGLWRWAFLPPELAAYSHCYNDFWTQLVRWLVSQSDFLPGQNLSLKTDHFTYSPGEPVNLMVFVRGKKNVTLAPLSITGPDGRSVDISLSPAGGKQADFLGTFRPKAPGDYVASLAAPGPRAERVSVPFGVLERREEDLNTSADPALMQQIAVAGGGEALSLSNLNELPDKLREAVSALIRKTEPRPAWDRWWVLATLLALLSAEWIVRRRIGLV